MDSIFYFIDLVVSIIGPVSDFFWEFPTNFEWYSSIPVLGEFSFSTFILVGSGIYFTFRLRFIQVAWFKKGVKILAIKRPVLNYGIFFHTIEELIEYIVKLV